MTLTSSQKQIKKSEKGRSIHKGGSICDSYIVRQRRRGNNAKAWALEGEFCSKKLSVILMKAGFFLSLMFHLVLSKTSWDKLQNLLTRLKKTLLIWSKTEALSLVLHYLNGLGFFFTQNVIVNEAIGKSYSDHFWRRYVEWCRVPGSAAVLFSSPNFFGSNSPLTS